VLKRQIGNLVLSMIIWSCAGGIAQASDWEISSETIFRALQRDTPQGSDQQVMPLYEYLGVEYNNYEAGGVAFYGYGWIRKDTAGSGYYEDDPEGELLYAYLSYERPYSAFKINLGRQHIFAGVANETVDGLRVDMGLGGLVSLSAYGGITAVSEDSAGNYTSNPIYGGRMSLLFSATAELGLSCKAIQGDSNNRDQTAGVDIYWSPFRSLSLDGRSAYNMETRGWREHNYNAQIIAGSFEISPVYQYFQYKDFFSTAENRNDVFRFLYNSEETLKSWGAEVAWHNSQVLEIGIKGRRYDYSLRETGADFLSAGLTLNPASDVLFGAELGRMDGHTPEDSYRLYRGFCIWSATRLLGASGQISADLLYQSYDIPIYGQDKAIFASLSAGRNFFNDKLRINAAVNYSQDPLFDSDVSGIITFLIKY
jgi:hypothetical protein